MSYKTTARKLKKITIKDGSIIKSPDGDRYKIKITSKSTFELTAVKEIWKVTKTYEL